TDVCAAYRHEPDAAPTHSGAPPPRAGLPSEEAADPRDATGPPPETRAVTSASPPPATGPSSGASAPPETGAPTGASTPPVTGPPPESAADPRRAPVSVRCLPHRPAVTVLGSPAGLQRALSALVDNAVRHARSTVTVEVLLRGGDAVVEVADDGPGLDPAVLPRLFERFGPAAGPTTGGRHGLGLALASEVVGRHGGRVTPVRQSGGGAVLRLTLPASRPRRRRWPPRS